jgi:hypothetical protein
MWPQKMSERIFEFPNGGGRTLANRLFPQNQDRILLGVGP